MNKLLLIFSSLMLSFNFNAQSLKQVTKVLKSVESFDELKALKAKYPNWSISIDKTLLSDSVAVPAVLTAKKGDLVKKQHNAKAPTFLVKVLTIEDEELCKVKYIFLDGKKYSKTEIDSIRTIIIQRYTDGEDFEKLVKEYNMDGNPTGDLGWFYQGMMVDEFDKAVRKRLKGEIVNVDVDSHKWYYVVLKNHDNKIEKAINGIKIQYKISPQ